MRKTRARTATKVQRKVRVYRTVTVERTVLQCERPYVLFGRAIAEARQRLRMTQQNLADKVGLCRPSITNIESGRQRVLLGDVFDFAAALEIKPESLLRACK